MYLSSDPSRKLEISPVSKMLAKRFMDKFYCS